TLGTATTLVIVRQRNLRAVPEIVAIGSTTRNTAAERRIETGPLPTGSGAPPEAIHSPGDKTTPDSKLAAREGTWRVLAMEAHREQAIVRVEEDWAATGPERGVAAPIALAVAISPAVAVATAMHSVAVRVDMTVPVLARAVAADLRV